MRWFLAVMWNTSGLGDPLLPSDSWEHGIPSCAAIELNTRSIRHIHEGDLRARWPASSRRSRSSRRNRPRAAIAGSAWFGLAYLRALVGVDGPPVQDLIDRIERLRHVGEHFAADSIEAAQVYPLAAAGDVSAALVALGRAERHPIRVTELPVVAVALQLAAGDHAAAAAEVAALAAEADDSQSTLQRCRTQWLGGLVSEAAGDVAAALRGAVDGACTAREYNWPREQIHALELVADLLAPSDAAAATAIANSARSPLGRAWATPGESSARRSASRTRRLTRVRSTRPPTSPLAAEPTKPPRRSAGITHADRAVGRRPDHRGRHQRRDRPSPS